MVKKLAKILYGSFFVLVIPMMLAAWARRLEVSMPAIQAPVWGTALASAGVFFLLTGMMTLTARGKGLPMNAFPPSEFIASGIYRWMAHPIYFGFVLACAGISLAYGSAPGLWVVTPNAALGCAAIVLGYEGRDLRRRFPQAREWRPWLSLPADGDSQSLWRERAAVGLLVLTSWALCYEAVKGLGIPRDAVDVRFDFERRIAVWPWMEWIYASVYLAVPATVLSPLRKSELRSLAMEGLVATGIVTLTYLCVPLISPPRAFHPDSIPGKLLAWEHYWAEPPVAAWPSFHVIWGLICAGIWHRRSVRWRKLAWVWATAVSISCIMTGMHAISDVGAGWVYYLGIKNYRWIWERMLRWAETLSNSWNARRVGSLRVINHGFYAGLASATGFLGTGLLSGGSNMRGLLIVAAASLAASALWAQWIEGSPALSRPFGYFGALYGGIVGICAVRFLGYSVQGMMAALAVMAPWVQALGRLRCLVQGCCHGAKTEGQWGIRVSNPHSRVTYVAELIQVPIHPTQLYSIVANGVIGIALLRLWTAHMSFTFIIGIYLIWSGLARFVEENYRGEPQTPRWFGLPMYQPLSLANVVAGMFISTIPAGRASMAAMSLEEFFKWTIAAAVCFCVYGFAMGVDFPESNRRFARLSG